MRGIGKSFFGVAAAMCAVPAVAAAAAVSGKYNGPPRIQKHYTTRGSIAKLNRWTGKPHEHKRERERNIRQAARLRANYFGNGGFTRRGNEAG